VIRRVLTFALFLFLRSFAHVVTTTIDVERQIFDWTNQERAKVNAPALQWNNRLVLAARLHCDAIARQTNLGH